MRHTVPPSRARQPRDHRRQQPDHRAARLDRRRAGAAAARAGPAGLARADGRWLRTADRVGGRVHGAARDRRRRDDDRARASLHALGARARRAAVRAPRADRGRRRAARPAGDRGQPADPARAVAARRPGRRDAGARSPSPLPCPTPSRPRCSPRLRRCPPTARHAARATSCPTSGRPGSGSSASPRSSPAATATARSRRPMFEQAAVFERGLGEATDAVEKELFRLAPRTDESESWALRPEPTAGIVRAYVQHGMQTLAAAGEARDGRPDVPLRPPAGRPVPPVLAVRRRGDRRSGPGGRRRDRRARAALLPRGGPRRRRGAAQLDRRRRLPAGLRRGAGRLLPRARSTSCRPLERDRLERNPLRLLDSKDPAMAALNAARAPDRRSAVCGLRRPLRRASGRTSTPSGSATGSSRAWSVGSTTTPGPRSSSTAAAPRASSRRSAAAAGTTAWSSCSAAGPTPGDRVRDRARPDRPRPRRSAAARPTTAPPGPLAVVVGADPDGTARRLALATELRARRASRPGRSSASGSSAGSSRRPPATGPTSRSSSATTRAEGQVQLRDLEAGTQRAVGRADLARELTRAAGSHQHG